MSKRIWIVRGLAVFALSGTAMFASPTLLLRDETPRPYDATPAVSVARQVPERRARKVVCSGRIESVRGEVDIAALIPGRLEEVRVTEGDAVNEGDVLAVLEGGREARELRTAEANVAVAHRKLERVQAGNGKEEIEQAYDDMKALEARLAYETINLSGLRKLYQKRSLTSDELQRKMYEVEQMTRQRDALQKRYEAVRRGPVPEDIEVARGQLAVAEAQLQRAAVEHDYHLIRATISGTVLEVYRHTGDSVATAYATPILRIADTSRLRIRLEVSETDVARIETGLEGSFQVRGREDAAGKLLVKTIVPIFGPRRLFNPDTSARNDTRTVTVLCEPRDVEIPMLLGQRVTAFLTERATEGPTRRPGASR
jgi:multidrug efflux pump subunit AcrA (membrane-fusion protein)